MLRPERRTRADLVAAAVLTVAVLVVGIVLWRGSEASSTTSQTAVVDYPPLVAPTTLPPAFAEAWRAPSTATPGPVVAGPSVVTAAGGEVLGRDPLTGEVRWRYRRDLDLCTVVSAWDDALAVYRKNPDFCSEVTALAGDSGRRVAQRNSNAEPDTAVLSDGVHVTAAGVRYLETWRSDLVRTTQYGKVPATVNPNRQPRSGCEYGSVAVNVYRIGVIERCAEDDTDRLTLLKANPEKAEQPEELYSTLLSDRGARVIAIVEERTAVLQTDPVRLVVYDDEGNQVAAHPMDFELPTTRAQVETPVTEVTGEAVYWFTGSSTIALDPANFTPLWEVAGTLGAGVMVAGQLLVPMPGELAVLDPYTGERLGSSPVDRGRYSGPVRLAAAGSVLLEQRGDQLVALR